MPATLLAKEGYKLVNLKGGINVRVVFIESFSQSKFPKKTGKTLGNSPKNTHRGTCPSDPQQNKSTVEDDGLGPNVFTTE